MSSPKAPSQQKVLPLVDPDNVREVFAHELSGIQARQDGTCHLTFSVSRPGHQMPGVTQNDPDHQRVVTARLVLPLPAVQQMMESFRQLLLAMKQAEAPPPRTN
jgi:hypothetical protein